jgi:hypothetical protein
MQSLAFLWFQLQTTQLYLHKRTFWTGTVNRLTPLSCSFFHFKFAQ